MSDKITIKYNDIEAGVHGKTPTILVIFGAFLLGSMMIILNI